MTLDELKKYMDPPQHARRYGVHTPPYRRQRSFRSADDRITLSEALRDSEVDEGVEQRHHQSRTDLRAPAPRDSAEENYYGHDFGFGREDAEAHCELPSAAETENMLVSADDGSLPVTVLSDEEPDPEENSSQEVLDFRQQRSRAMNARRRFDSDNWDNEGRWNGSNTVHIGGDGNERLRHLDAMMARSRMDDSPRLADQPEERPYSYDRRNAGRDLGARTRSLREDNDYSAIEPLLDGSERYDDGLNDPNVTRARFYIRESKYKVAIRFEPPVSGRFILLKLWANRSNVDLQSVIAKGYGGCRFFNAVEMR